MTVPDIHLYTASTMNGWKPLIFLHEAEVPYELTPIDLGSDEQKSDWYLKINPNGRIPAIVDRGNGDFAVFESGAILWYLAEKYGRFLSSDPKERSQTLQWVMFQVAGIGPMMGQAMYFQRIAKPKGVDVPFAIQRYVAESRRLLEVLDRRLRGRTWLVGEAYSIADMVTYPWVKSHFWATASVDGLDGVNAWLARIDVRPKTQAALQIPVPKRSFFGEGDVPAEMTENAASFDLPSEAS